MITDGQKCQPHTQKVCVQIVAVLLLMDWLPAARCSDSNLTERDALGAIFGDSIRIDSALETHLSAAAMSPDDRFRFLSKWVLPSEDHDSFRVDIGFLPVHAAPPVANSFPDSTVSTVAAGDLVSPAIDLVLLAREQNRLPHLRALLNGRQPDDVEQQKAVVALQTIMALSVTDFEQAKASMQQLFELAAANPVVVSERGPEAVTIWFARQHPEMFEATRDMAMLVYEQARTQQGPRSERWHRHVSSLKRWYLGIGDHAEDTDPSRKSPLTHWKPTSRMTANTRGSGYPQARWEARRSGVTHVTSHDHDYLYYAIPMKGDLTVEADVTTFDYREIHLGFGNIWAGISHNHKSVWCGAFREPVQTPDIDPPLSKIDKQMRVRVDARDGLRTTWTNRRRIYETEHTAKHDPWLSIHSGWASSGTVQNLIISGSPQIPDEIDLAAIEELPGWQPYFDESAGRLGDWRWERANTSFGETPVLRGRRNVYPDTVFESLLRYHRPMFEDGMIEYDFLYGDSTESLFHTHPTLDRLVFLLAPEGVRIHWLTDGKYDWTDLDPANATTEPDNRRGPERLPLKQGDWNHLQLKLKGDTVDLMLNGVHVYSRILEATNQRTFGLFHYADRAEARVRNIHWKGDWPKQLPSIREQELVNDPSLQLLESGAALPLVFYHDFADGLPPDRFAVFDGGLGTDITEHSDGIHVSRPGAEGLIKYTLGPRLRLGGDFEITAEFADMQTSLSPGGQCNCYLLAEIDDKQNSHVRIFRGDHTNKQIVYSTNYILVNEKRRYRIENEVPEAATSGRLRLLRCGTKMYYLFAEFDSPNFRLIDTLEVGTEMTVSNRLRLGVQTGKPGSTSAVWKRLTIRADKVVREWETTNIQQQ